MPAVRQAADGDDGRLRWRNWRQLVVQLPTAAERLVEGDVAIHDDLPGKGFLFRKGEILTLRVEQVERIRRATFIMFRGEVDSTAAGLQRNFQRLLPLPIQTVLLDRLIDLLDRRDDGLFIHDESLMGPHLFDINEGIETTEIEQRPICARAKRPDRV